MEIQKISTSLLQVCVRTDDVVGARRLLAGVDKQERKLIVAKRGNCDPPLFIAAKRGNVDMVNFLAEECGADLEERGTYTSSVGIVELVTPLWYVVVLNKFEMVKRLIYLGADINAVSGFRETSVLGACIMNVKFHLLTDKSFKEKLDIVQFLIDHGFDLQKKNRWGDDVFQIASLDGQGKILDKLLHNFELPIRRSIEVNELLGSFYANHVPITIRKVLYYWRKAVEMRRIHSHYNDNALQPHPVYGVTKEVTTVEELEALCQDHQFVYMRSLMIRERILGVHHYRILPALLSRGLMHKGRREYRLCIDILKHAFQLQSAEVEHMSVDRLRYGYLHILSYLCSVIFDIHIECKQPNNTDNFVIKFEDIFAVLEMVSSKVKAVTRILVSDEFQNDEGLPIMFMNYILQLVELIIELDKNENQLLIFRKAVYNLVHSHPITKQRQSLLHLSVQPCTSKIDGKFYSRFPSIAVVELLLECGINVNAVDDQHNTALHLCSISLQILEVQQYHDLMKRIAELLLKNDAHVDMVNFSGYNAAVVLKSSVLEMNILDFISLKCLAARAVKKFKIPYVGHIITSLEPFVKMHG